ARSVFGVARAERANTSPTREGACAGNGERQVVIHRLLHERVCKRETDPIVRPFVDYSRLERSIQCIQHFGLRLLAGSDQRIEVEFLAEQACQTENLLYLNWQSSDSFEHDRANAAG